MSAEGDEPEAQPLLNDEVAAKEAKEQSSWITDDRIWIRHPYSRMFTSLLVIFCLAGAFRGKRSSTLCYVAFCPQIIVFDFIIHDEDPIQDSLVQASLPVVGNVINMFTHPYPGTWGWIKIAMCFFSTIVGLFIGRQWLHHLVCVRPLARAPFAHSPTYMFGSHTYARTQILRDHMGLNMFEGDKGTFLVRGVRCGCARTWARVFS